MANLFHQSLYYITLILLFYTIFNWAIEEKIKVYTGPGKEDGYVTAQHKVEKAVVNPLYRSISFAVGLVDVAYLRLENPLPFNGTPFLLSPKSIRKALKKGQKSLLIGYGRRGKEREDGFGLKYQTELTV